MIVFALRLQTCSKARLPPSRVTSATPCGTCSTSLCSSAFSPFLETCARPLTGHASLQDAPERRCPLGGGSRPARPSRDVYFRAAVVVPLVAFSLRTWAFFCCTDRDFGRARETCPQLRPDRRASFAVLIASFARVAPGAGRLLHAKDDGYGRTGSHATAAGSAPAVPGA